MRLILKKDVMYASFLILLIPIANRLPALFSDTDRFILRTFFALISIIIALIIFYVGWKSYRTELPGNLFMFSILFLVVAILDFLHLVSNKELSGWIAPNHYDKSIVYWLSSRAVIAFTLLFFSAAHIKSLNRLQRILFTHFCFAFIIAIFLAGFIYEKVNFATYLNGEAFIIVIHFVNLLILLFSQWQVRLFDRKKMCAAVFLMMLTEICFTFYTSLSDHVLLLGHIYKCLAYFLICQAVFQEHVTHPMKHKLQSIRTEAKTRTILDQLKAAMITITPDGKIVHTNELAASEYVDLKQNDDFPVENDHLILPDRLHQVWLQGRSHANHYGKWNKTIIEQNEHGQRKVYEYSVIAHRDEHEDINGYTIICKDVTSFTEAKHIKQLALSIIDQMNEGVIITDANKRIVYVNQSFTKITGYTLKDIVGQTPGVLSSGWHKKSFYDAMWECMENYGTWQGELWNKRKDGSMFLEKITIHSIKDENDQLNYFYGIFTDITEEKKFQSEIEYYAYHDSSTGLPNRITLLLRMVQAFKYAEQNDKKSAIMAIKMERSNDNIIKIIGERIVALLRASDTVARLQDNMIGVLLPDVHDHNDVIKVAKKIIDSVQFENTMKIGISLFPDDGNDPDKLLLQAETALNDTKPSENKFFAFYSSSHS